MSEAIDDVEWVEHLYQTHEWFVDSLHQEVRGTHKVVVVVGMVEVVRVVWWRQHGVVVCGWWWWWHHHRVVTAGNTVGHRVHSSSVHGGVATRTNWRHGIAVLKNKRSQQQ